ncbi:MAG: hypothetical protein ABSA02_08630 [Trebonia sp.]|jgi:hypothetical protein
MSANYDAELSQLAAEILREAVQVYGLSDPGQWLANPVLAAWNTNMFGGLAPTTSFAAVTGSFAAATGSFAPLTGSMLTSAESRPAPTGAFKAFTGAFRAIADAPPPPPPITLKRVFRLPSRLPGVRLPPDAELAAMARSSPAMAGLDALARWLGRDGRLVSQTDALPAADAADAAGRLGIRPQYLSFLWEYALTSGWFELIDADDQKRTWAVIGRTAWRWTDGDDLGAMRVWATVFATVLATALDVAADADLSAARKLTFDGQGPALAVMLFLARPDGLTQTQVEDLVRDSAIGERPTARTRRAWDAWVRQHGDPAHLLLGELAAIRAVYPPRRAGDGIILTPLALWALREQFARDEISVPLLAEPGPRMTAASLVALSSSVSEAEFETDLAAWMRGRDPDRAAREVLAFAAFGGPQDRLDAVRVAGRLGMVALRAWRDAMQRPELRGYARIALAQLAANPAAARLGPLPEPAPDDMIWLATDFLAVASEPGGLDSDEFATLLAKVMPESQQGWVIALMARSSNPEVVAFLDLLSNYYPDRKVARDARRAARAAGKNRDAAARNVRVPARAAGR